MSRNSEDPQGTADVVLVDIAQADAVRVRVNRACTAAEGLFRESPQDLAPTKTLCLIELEHASEILERARPDPAQGVRNTMLDQANKELELAKVRFKTSPASQATDEEQPLPDRPNPAITHLKVMLDCAEMEYQARNAHSAWSDEERDARLDQLTRLMIRIERGVEEAGPMPGGREDSPAGRLMSEMNTSVEAALQSHYNTSGLRKAKLPVVLSPVLTMYEEGSPGIRDFTDGFRKSNDPMSIAVMSRDDPGRPEPQNKVILVAYEHDGQIMCKTAAEAYPEGFPQYGPLLHAHEVGGLADDPRLSGLKAEITELAEMIAHAAMTGLSSVQHQDVLDLLDEAEAAGADPVQIRDALNAATLGNRALAIVIAADSQRTEIVTQEQTQVIIQAAKSSGVHAGTVAHLAEWLGAEAEDHQAQKGQVTDADTRRITVLAHAGGLPANAALMIAEALGATTQEANDAALAAGYRPEA